jgi:hypothetical protein
MGKPSKAVMNFMAKYNVDSDEIWEVHGSTWVVKHKALERVAAEQGIVFEEPKYLPDSDVKQGFVTILVTGRMGEARTWAFGEAGPKNNKNAYPVAMAEKRGKDRVILKLLDCHGALYSEAEADEFAQKRPNPHVTRPEDIFEPVEYDGSGQPIDNIPAPDEDAIKKLRVADQKPIFAAMQKEIHATGTIAELTAWAEANRNRLGALKPDYQDFVRGVYAEHRDSLRLQDQQDDRRLAS